MISLSKIKNSGAASRYFEGGDYYAKDDGGNSTMGTWSGEAASHLKLDREVSIPQFKNLLDGKLPTGEQLGKPTGGDEAKAHTKGWDITFSAPKSVSIMALVAGDKRLIEAHESAVKTALGYTEKNFVTTRVSEDGQTKHEKTQNAAFASFTHTTSRSLDPQLHTHNVMMNATLSKDGKWRSIDSRVIYNNSMAISSIYKMELASLVKELGYETVKGKHGNIEIKGVSQDLIDQFSQRREQILKAKEEHGYTTAKGMDKAAVRTRDKKVEVSEKELKGKWEQVANKDLAALQQLVSDSSRAQTETIGGETPKKQLKVIEAGVLSAIENLSERNATFTHTQLINETHRWLDGKIGVSAIETGITKAVIKEKILDGEFRGQLGYTTKAQLKVERDLIKTMGAGQGKGKELGPSWLADVKAHELKFNDGQASTLRQMVSSRDLFLGVQGYAGVGKTYMLKGYKQIADDQSHKILGFAPTNNAAQILQKESGIETNTTAKLVWNIKNNKTSEYAGVRTFLVDEGSLLGSKDLKTIADYAMAKKVQVVLLGDKHQLNSVAAGKPFEQVTSSGLDTAVMNEIMRQKSNPKLLNSILSIVGNEPSKAFKYLDEKIIEEPNKNARLEYMVDKYLGLSPSEREQHLLLIPDNDTRHTINSMIQQRLIDAGELNKSDSTEITSLHNKQLTDKEKATSQFYEVGNFVAFSLKSQGVKLDTNSLYEVVEKKESTLILKDESGVTHKWDPAKNVKHSSSAEAYEAKRIELHEGESIKSTRTDKEAGVRSGMSAVVEKIDREASTLHLKDQDGRRHTIPSGKAANWDLAYSSTVYVSQGATVKNVTLHLESHRINLTNLKTAYVGLTRSTGDVDMVIDNKEKMLDALQTRTGERTSAMELKGLDAKDDFAEGSKSARQKFTESVRAYFGMETNKLDKENVGKSQDSMEMER